MNSLLHVALQMLKELQFCPKKTAPLNQSRVDEQEEAHHYSNLFVTVIIKAAVD